MAIEKKLSINITVWVEDEHGDCNDGFSQLPIYDLWSSRTVSEKGLEVVVGDLVKKFVDGDGSITVLVHEVQMSELGGRPCRLVNVESYSN